MNACTALGSKLMSKNARFVKAILQSTQAEQIRLPWARSTSACATSDTRPGAPVARTT